MVSAASEGFKAVPAITTVALELENDLYTDDQSELHTAVLLLLFINIIES